MKDEDKEAQLNALKIQHSNMVRIYEQSGMQVRILNQKIGELEQEPTDTPREPAPNGTDPAKVEATVPA